MNFSKSCWLSLALLFFIAACTSEPAPPPPKPKPPVKSVKVPRFESDSAFVKIEKQLSFGPRVPNTTSHDQCRAWLVNQFEAYGAEVIEQKFVAKAYTGVNLKGTNVIAQYQPNHKKRIILAAHWDSRHISDADSNAANKKKGVPAADDGASGVAVLLEIARNLQSTPIDMGIDLILFDAEDHGDGENDNPTSWCLGSQHWSRNIHRKGYTPKYGILLDMVGAKNARFTKEEVSRIYAPKIVEKVWRLAKNMGYSNYFIDEESRGITDDHLFVNQLAKIPMIDIINRSTETSSGFGHYWHTQKDNIEVIDKRTLRAVGQVLLASIYNESIGKF